MLSWHKSSFKVLVLHFVKSWSILDHAFKVNNIFTVKGMIKICEINIESRCCSKSSLNTELEHYKWDLGYKEVSLGILIYFIYFVVMLNGCSKLQSHLTKNHVSKLYCMMISMIFVFKHCLGGFEKGDTIWNLNNIQCNTRVCIIVNVHVVSFK